LEAVLVFRKCLKTGKVRTCPTNAEVLLAFVDGLRSGTFVTSCYTLGMSIRLRIALDVPTSQARCETEGTAGLYLRLIFVGGVREIEEG
jgi:hypothetical protein